MPQGMKVVPLNDKIVVKRLEADDKTAGGILLPDTAKEKPRQGKVVSLGEGKRLESGKRAPFQVREGDRLPIFQWCGHFNHHLLRVDGTRMEPSNAAIFARRVTKEVRQLQAASALPPGCHVNAWSGEWPGCSGPRR